MRRFRLIIIGLHIQCSVSTRNAKELHVLQSPRETAFSRVGSRLKKAAEPSAPAFPTTAEIIQLKEAAKKIADEEAEKLSALEAEGADEGRTKATQKSVDEQALSSKLQDIEIAGKEDSHAMQHETKMKNSLADLQKKNEKQLQEVQKIDDANEPASSISETDVSADIESANQEADEANAVLEDAEAALEAEETAEIDESPEGLKNENTNLGGVGKSPAETDKPKESGKVEEEKELVSPGEKKELDLQNADKGSAEENKELQEERKQPAGAITTSSENKPDSSIMIGSGPEDCKCIMEYFQKPPEEKPKRIPNVRYGQEVDAAGVPAIEKDAVEPPEVDPCSAAERTKRYQRYVESQKAEKMEPS